MGDETSTEVRVIIRSDADVVTARQQGRAIAAQLGFLGSDLTIIATAISEMARNMVSFAGSGEIILAPTHQGPKQGILVIARDEGPGIPNITQAMQDGYSTIKSLGLGLPGTKRLMDEFEIFSEVGKGTKVTMKKWRR